MHPYVFMVLKPLTDIVVLSDNNKKHSVPVAVGKANYLDYNNSNDDLIDRTPIKSQYLVNRTKQTLYIKDQTGMVYMSKPHGHDAGSGNLEVHIVPEWRIVQGERPGAPAPNELDYCRQEYRHVYDFYVNNKRELVSRRNSIINASMVQEISLKLITEANNGYTVDGTDLTVFLSKEQALKSMHHTEYLQPSKWLTQTIGMEVRVYTREGPNDKLFANIGGQVVELKCERTSADEYAIINIRDRREGHITQTTYSLESLMAGTGHKGVRVYKTYRDAEDDYNRPLTEFQKQKKEKVLNKYKQEQEKAKQEYEDFIADIKFKREKEINIQKQETLKYKDDLRHKKSKERLSYIGKAIDIVSGFFTICTALLRFAG